jgi:hypothetical protein
MMKQIKWKPALAIMLAVVMVLAAFPQQSKASEVCMRAFEKCTVDAFISLVLSGPMTAGILMSGCVNGYAFCLKYFKG